MTAYLIAHPNGFTETAEGLVELEQMLPMPDEAQGGRDGSETVPGYISTREHLKIASRDPTTRIDCPGVEKLALKQRIKKILAENHK